MKRLLRIGTRGSRLALAQAGEIARLLKKKYPSWDVRLAVIQTPGDEFQSVEIFKKENQGVFTTTIERKLIASEIDIAVHSLKDLPTTLAKGLCLAAFPKREDARDALVSRKKFTLRTLPAGAVVGTGSPRRKSQACRLRPDLKVVAMRGNLDTRIAKVLKEKKYDAVLVAYAGLRRIQKYLRYARPVPAQELLPAVGQAALAVQARSADREILKRLKFLNHTPTEKSIRAERAFLQALRGGCRVPVGIISEIKGGKIHLRASVFSVKTNDFLSAESFGAASKPERAGEMLAAKLLKKGAARFLREARE